MADISGPIAATAVAAAAVVAAVATAAVSAISGSTTDSSNTAANTTTAPAKTEKPKVTKRGITVKDVSAADFIKTYALFLKKSGKIQLPKWHDIVKTGKHKELAPYNVDWYYVRTASIARRVYLRGGVGVGALKKVYGGAQRNGTRPSHFSTASGAIIRSIFHNLEKIKVIQQDRKGRRLTASGRRDLDRIAQRVVNQAAKAQN